MNKYISYISVLMLGTVGLSSCNDNWETPPMVYPEATMQANVGLDALKTKYWSTDRNSVNTVGTAGDITSNAELAVDSAIFRGRVISESASGNIYNSIVVQGEDCALNISVRTNKLTAIPAFGQEIFVNVTGMKIGNYNGLMQLGAEGTYNGAPSMTFMESADFEAKMQINGVPDPSKVDTVLITLPEIADKSSATLQKYQSQLVRIDGLTFTEPGQPFAGSQNTNRAAKDAQGNTINVRTSSYASFKNSLVPTGTGTVVGILSYFGNDWQLLLNDITGIIGFDETTNPDNPDTPSGDATGEGTAASPFNTVKALEFTKALAADATTEQEYYVQGTVTSIKELSTQFGNASYTITSEGTTVGFDIFRGKYLDGASFTADDQLKVGDKVVVCGKLVNFKGNTPQMAQGSKLISINGQGGTTTPETGEGKGEGTAASPFNSVKALEFTKALAADAATAEDYYVEGSVTAIKEISTQYGNATYTITSEGTTTGFDIFRGYYLNGDKFTAADQLKVGDKVIVCGKLVNYKGNTPQMNQGGKLISINGSGASTTPDTPSGN